MSTSSRLWSARYALAGALVIACASSSSPAGSTTAGRAPARNSDVITRADLDDPSLIGGTLLEAIEKLRPRFVNDRGGAIGGVKESVMVSINGADPLPIAELGRIRIPEVTEIRYFSTADAGLRFGMRSSMGPVLLVTTTTR